MTKTVRTYVSGSYAWYSRFVQVYLATNNGVWSDINTKLTHTIKLFNDKNVYYLILQEYLCTYYYTSHTQKTNRINSSRQQSEQNNQSPYTNTLHNYVNVQSTSYLILLYLNITSTQILLNLVLKITQYKAHSEYEPL